MGTVPQPPPRARTGAGAGIGPHSHPTPDITPISELSHPAPPSSGYFLDRLGGDPQGGRSFHPNSWDLHPPRASVSPARVPTSCSTAFLPRGGSVGLALASPKHCFQLQVRNFSFPVPASLWPGLLHLHGPRPHLRGLGELCVCHSKWPACGSPRAPSLQVPSLLQRL